MSINELIEKLKDEFENIIEINNISQINQAGVYLYFEGINPVSMVEDKAKVMVLCANQTLSKKGNSNALDMVQSIRDSIFKLSSTSGKSIEFAGVKSASFENSTLFVYAISITAKITLDVALEYGIDQ